MGIKIIDIDNEMCPLPLLPITGTGWGSCLMDLTGMVSIIPLGSRTDAGVVLGELGLLGLIVVGWGQRWSWIFPECCQVPGKVEDFLQPPPWSG